MPPPPAPSAPEPAPDRRALELRYLDGLLLEHSVWQEVYTPMAGVGQLRLPATPAAPGRARMRTTPTNIDVGYLTKSSLAQDMAETIRATFQSKMVFSSEVGAPLVSPPRHTVDSHLTDREL